jgi:hypothetical protein
MHSNINAVLVKAIEAEQAAQRNGVRGVTASRRRSLFRRGGWSLHVRARLANRSPLSSSRT